MNSYTNNGHSNLPLPHTPAAKDELWRNLRDSVRTGTPQIAVNSYSVYLYTPEGGRRFDALVNTSYEVHDADTHALLNSPLSDHVIRLIDSDKYRKVTLVDLGSKHAIGSSAWMKDILPVLKQKGVPLSYRPVDACESSKHSSHERVRDVCKDYVKLHPLVLKTFQDLTIDDIKPEGEELRIGLFNGQTAGNHIRPGEDRDLVRLLGRLSEAIAPGILVVGVDGVPRTRDDMETLYNGYNDPLVHHFVNASAEHAGIDASKQKTESRLGYYYQGSEGEEIQYWLGLLDSQTIRNSTDEPLLLAAGTRILETTSFRFPKHVLEKSLQKAGLRLLYNLNDYGYHMAIAQTGV